MQKMDIIDIFSFAQIVYLVFTVAILWGIYFAFRNREEYVKITVLYILAVINLLQHFFKFIIWPNCFGTSFNLINTAYNVCAFQIILTPFLIQKKKGLLKEFIVYSGSIGCILSFLYPSWFIGKTIFQWEFLRFWVCHFLLLATSILPVLWGMMRFERKNYWKIGIVWFVMLCVILFNDICCIYMGLEGDPSRLYQTLYELNPFSIMHPNVPILGEIIKWVSPPIFMGSKSGVYTPILWYIIPLYVLMTPTAYGFSLLWERLEQKYFILSLDGTPKLKKSKRKIYYEKRNYLCKTF